MSMPVQRRTVLKALLASSAGVAALKAPAVHAQTKPFKLGLLTVKSGPLAQGGLQMEQGVLSYLKEKNNTLGGRHCRHRRQSGRRQDQGPGAGGT
jgi:branched-chain amino acid transport system substrate-binding protein